MFLHFLVLFLFFLVSSKDITIDTSLGTIRGTVHESTGMQTTYSFYGIQYGQSPIGSMRFRQSQMNETKWNGVYDGTTFGSKCMQTGSPSNEISEDCLFLNVWTPKPNNSNELLPVMLFIHGGSFIDGAGSSSSFDGVNFVGTGRDFVYVSINYRLNKFGFLSNEQLYNEDPSWKSYGGLNGVNDQITALKYVQKYISDYGGNPNKITIFGESAGALSVCMLTLSPLAKGLFHRAIIESGSCNGPWGPTNTSYALQLWNSALEQAGYPINNITYLRSISADDLLNRVVNPAQVDGVDGLVLPVLPSEMFNDLSKYPLNVEKLIIGYNTMDGIIGFPWHGGPRPTTEEEYTQFLSEYIPNATQANAIQTYYYPISDFKFYPPDHNEYELAWFTINADVCLTCSSLELGDAISSQTTDNVVYEYQFGGPGNDGSYYAPHASELPFVFDIGSGSSFYEMPFNQKLSNQMVSAWTNFGKYGVPNITDTMDNFDFDWVTFNDGKSNDNVILFENEIKMIKDFGVNYRKNVCDYWYKQVGHDIMFTLCFDKLQL